MLQEKVMIEWMVKGMMTSTTKEEFQESANKIMEYINKISEGDIYLKISLVNHYESELTKYAE